MGSVFAWASVGQVISRAAINIVSKHDGGPRDCELVSLSPGARWDPDTDILQGSRSGTVSRGGPGAPSDHDIDFEMEAS